MNYSFKLSNLSVNIGCKETPVEVKIENLDINLTDLSIKDITGLVTALPGVVRELRQAIEMPLGAPIVTREATDEDEADNLDIEHRSSILAFITSRPFANAKHLYGDTFMLPGGHRFVVVPHNPDNAFPADHRYIGTHQNYSVYMIVLTDEDEGYAKSLSDDFVKRQSELSEEDEIEDAQ